MNQQSDSKLEQRAAELVAGYRDVLDADDRDHLRRAILAFAQAVAAESAPRWIPVGERLPEVGDRVVAMYANVYDGRVVTYWNNGAPRFGTPYEVDRKGTQPATSSTASTPHREGSRDLS